VIQSPTSERSWWEISWGTISMALSLMAKLLQVLNEPNAMSSDMAFR
jgi:hypothetical protein